MSGQHDRFRIATKTSDIRFDPLQCHLEIANGEITWRNPLHEEIAEQTEPIVHGDHDGAPASRELVAEVARQRAAARQEATPVNPEDDRQFAGKCGREDVKAKGVLRHVRAFARWAHHKVEAAWQLRKDRSWPCTVAFARPCGRRKRRGKPTRVGSIGNIEECVDPVVQHALENALCAMCDGCLRH